MTNPTPEQLAEWKRLADAATEGPWSSRHEITGESGRSLGPELIVRGTFEERLAAIERLRKDADFITASRTAVPALVAAVERLTAERDAATMAERERCAKVAETLIPNGKGKSQNVAYVAGHHIAAAIRAGGTT